MWGADHKIQTITIYGSPQVGTWYAGYRGYWSVGIAPLASAATVQTAIRTLPDLQDATVVLSGNGTSSPSVYTVTPNASVSIVEPIKTRSTLSSPFDGTSATYAKCLSTFIEPLIWNSKGVRPSSVAAVAARTLIPGSNERASQIKVTEFVAEDLFGGLGIRDYIEGERVDRFFDSSVASHARKQITLLPRKHTPTYSGFTRRDGTTSVTPDYMAAAIEYGGIPYAIFISYNAVDSTISHFAKYTKASDTWTQITDVGPTKQVFTSATSAHHNDLVVYNSVLYIANGTTTLRRYDASTNTLTAVVTGSAGVQSLTVYDLKLIRIDTDGGVYYATSVGGAWTSVGTFSEESSVSGSLQIQAIRTWRNIKGQAVVYVIHSKGLHEIDIGVGEITRHLSISGISSAAPAMTAAMYQGDLIFLTGGVLRYNLNDLTDIGVEREQGLPKVSKVIGQTLPNTTKPVAVWAINNWLFVSYAWQQTLWQLGTAGHSELGLTTTLSGASGQANTGMVLGYNGRGWHVVSKYTVTQNASTAGKYGNAFWWNDMCFFGNGTWVTWPDSADNPALFSGMEYEATGDLILSWLDKGLTDVLKAFYWVKVRGRQISSTSVIRVRYQIDNAGDDAAIVSGGDPRSNWVPLVDKDGNDFVVNSALLGGTSGLAYGYFSRELLHDGVTLKSPGVEALMMRLWFALARGTASGQEIETPILESSTTTLDVLFDPLFGFSLSADISKLAGNRDTERQIADLIRLHKSTRLQPFAYSDNDVLMVRLDQFVGDGIETGFNQAGRTPVLSFIVSERLGER